MKKVLTVLMAVVVVATWLHGQTTFQATSATDLFYEALHLEEVKGDLHEAIAIYQQIPDRFADDRSIAARALVRMAQCYETLGQPEASAAYERVLREYAEQAEQVGVARTRLAAVATGVTEEVTAGPNLSLVLNEAIVSSQHRWATSRDFSPSGDQIVFMARWDFLEPDRAKRGPGAMVGAKYIEGHA